MADLFAARPLAEVKQELLGRAKQNRNPFLYTIFEEVAPVINRLGSVDREDWARAFSSLAAPHEARGRGLGGGRRTDGEERIFDRL